MPEPTREPIPPLAVEDLEGTWSAEAHGATKKAEGLPWLLDYARAQSQPFGKLYIGFGDPISVRGELGAPAQFGGLDKRARGLELQKLALPLAIGAWLGSSSEPGDVDATIKQAMEINDRPVVIDFIVHRDAMVWPMVAAGTSNDDIKFARDMAPDWGGSE